LRGKPGAHRLAGDVCLLDTEMVQDRPDVGRQATRRKELRVGDRRRAAMAALVEDDHTEAIGERLQELLDVMPARAQAVRGQKGWTLTEDLDRKTQAVRGYALRLLGHPVLRAGRLTRTRPGRRSEFASASAGLCTQPRQNILLLAPARAARTAG
jgi:hypothetical protein